MDEEEEVGSPGRKPARPSAHLESGTGVASRRHDFVETGQHAGAGSRADEEIMIPVTDAGSDATPIYGQMNKGSAGQLI